MTELSAKRALLLDNSLSARVIVYSLLVTVLVTSLMALPLIAHYSETWLKNRVAASYLVSLVTEASPNGLVDLNLQKRLLGQTSVLGITVQKADGSTLVLGPNMPLVHDYYYELHRSSILSMLNLLMNVSSSPGKKIIHITDNAPGNDTILVEVDVGCHDLFVQAIESTKRAIGTALFTALLMSIFFYVFIHITVGYPLQRLTNDILAFRTDPNNVYRVSPPSGRIDEIGIAEEAFQQMQNDIRSALALRAHLAAIGMAVTKIQHDLRGSLASAMVASDTLEASFDPEVRRVLPSLIAAIDRAVDLCRNSINFAKEGPIELQWKGFNLFTLIDELFKECGSIRQGELINLIPKELSIVGDRAQFSRAIGNLVRNALEADANKIVLSALIKEDMIEIDVSDNGTGIPEKVKSQLFTPFMSSTKNGSSGLGLSIVRDVVLAHGGTISLVVSGPGRTVFSVRLPFLTDF